MVTTGPDGSITSISVVEKTSDLRTGGHTAEVPVSLDDLYLVAATDGVLRFEVEGEIDLSSAPALLDAVLCAALANDHRQVVIDLRHVTFIDSSGLAAVVEMRRRLRDNGTHLVVTGPSDPVRRIFEMTGLADVVDLQSGWPDQHTERSGS